MVLVKKSLEYLILPSFSHLFTDFRTVFCFLSRTFRSHVGIFSVDVNENYKNGKMAKNLFSAIKSSRNALKPSEKLC